MRQKESNRVLGPYKDRSGWRLIIFQHGIRETRVVASLERANYLKKKLEKEVQALSPLTVQEAFIQYEEYLEKVRLNRPQTIEAVFRRLRVFFPNLELSLEEINSKMGNALYQNLIGSYAVATHRRMLTCAKAFLTWCVKQQWMKKNPLEGVEGQGKCRKGKLQLRFDEAKVWLHTAFELAHKGEEGAVSALITLLLGLRASEIVSLTVRDIDNEGRLLWVSDSKTEAGKRTLEIPTMLQPLLLDLCQGKSAEELLFGKHWRDWPREWVQRICQKAKVSKVTAHGMRGLHSTLAIQAGASPQMVARSLGHTSFSTTLQYYTAPGAFQAQQQKRVLKALQREERKEEIVYN